MCGLVWCSSASHRAQCLGSCWCAYTCWGFGLCNADRFRCLNEALGVSAITRPSLWLLLRPEGMVHVELRSLFLQQLLTVIF